MNRSAISISFAPALIWGYVQAQPVERRTIEPAGNFNSVTVTGNHRVHILSGQGPGSIEAEGLAQQLDNFEVHVRNNTLCIRFKEGHEPDDVPVSVWVPVAALKAAEVCGEGLVTVSGETDCSNNKFTVSGSGRIEVEKVDCRKAEFTVTGTGSIGCGSVTVLTLLATVAGGGETSLAGISSSRVDANIKGHGQCLLSGCSKNADIRINGRGCVDARALEAKEARVALAGQGIAHIRATGILDANPGRDGTVYYYGEPAVKMFDGGGPRSFIRQ